MNKFHLKRPAAVMLANVPLRGVLIAAFTALAIGAVGTVGTLAYHAGQQAVTTLARQLLAEVGERINQRLTSYFSGPEYVVQSNAALIRQGRLDWGDTAALARHFAGQLRLFTGVTSIGLVTENREFLLLERFSPDALMFRQFGPATGYLLQRYRADRDGQPGELIESRQNFNPHNDPPGNPWYPVAREAGQGGWRMSVSLGRGQDQPVLVSFYHRPFYDASGALQGVLVAGMTLTSIGEFLQGLKVSATGQAFLIDRQGMLVATSTGETPFDQRARADHPQNVAVQSRRLLAVDSANPLTGQATRQLLAHEPALERMAAPQRFDFEFSGQRYFTEVAPLVQEMSHPDWLTVVVAPERDFIALIIAHLHPLILLAGLGLVIAILLGLLAAGWISRPLAQLNMASRRLAEGDFSQPIPLAPIRELRDLGESFGKMTRRLHEAFAELRAAQQDLADDNQRLERRVEERTAELVAEQKRVVEAMAQVAQSEAKFRGIFEQSPLGVVLIDARTGRLLEVNERLAQMLGRTREELATIGWTPVTHPDDLPTERDSVARLQAGETAGFQLDKRYLHPDGTVVWAHLTVASVIVGTEGSPLHLGLIQDITARKTAEAQWQASERKMRRMLDNIPMAIAACTLEPDSRVIYLNEQFVRTFGYTLEDIPTLNEWFIRAYPDEEYRVVFPKWI